jgi:glycosyltransferase involved in cell wall biosynthesis
MRIAFVAQPFDLMYPPVPARSTASLALWIYYMARVCANRGHQVIVFGNHGGRFSAKSTRSDNVEYIFTPTGLDRMLNKTLRAGSTLFPNTGKENKLCPLFASPWYHRMYAMEVARRAWQLGCDVVHVINYSQFVPVIRQLHPRCKISLNMSCEWLTQLDPKLVKKRLKQTDIVVGCSEYITRKIARKFPEYADRCITVPNATREVSSPSGPSQDKTVLFVGRLSPEKGVHHLIPAFHRVLERFPDARLCLVGGASPVPFELLVGLSDEPHVRELEVFYQVFSLGARYDRMGTSGCGHSGNETKDPYLTVLQNQAGQEMGKRIIFEGHVTHDRVETYYKGATLLVNPSLSESFGNSVIEAMMYGLPVVATRVGGMMYTVDNGRTGLLVDVADPQALAKAICEVLQDWELACRMGDAGRQRVMEKFSWDRTADLLLEADGARCAAGDTPRYCSSVGSASKIASSTMTAAICATRSLIVPEIE